MDLQIQELKNSIMEEVILKNYKLLQFVENEMNKLKDEMNLLKKENAHLKEENKMNKNLFYNSQNTMIIGYDNTCKQPVSWNIDKAFLIPSFKESSDLSDMIRWSELLIIMSIDVFKHINKFNNFKTFNICRLSSSCFIDENFNKLFFGEYIDIREKNITKIESYRADKNTWFTSNDYLDYGPNCHAQSTQWFYKPSLKKLLHILDECNIKLLWEKSELIGNKSIRELILS
jgi:hypothetical protein